MAEKKRKSAFDQQAAKYLTSTQKPSEPKSKRDRTWDAQRSKATYDLPSELIIRIREIAKELGQDGVNVKVNDVARLLIEAGLDQYDAGELDVQLKPTGYTLFDND